MTSLFVVLICIYWIPAEAESFFKRCLFTSVRMYISCCELLALGHFSIEQTSSPHVNLA